MAKIIKSAWKRSPATHPDLSQVLETVAPAAAVLAAPVPFQPAGVLDKKELDLFDTQVAAWETEDGIPHRVAEQLACNYIVQQRAQDDNPLCAFLVDEFDAVEIKGTLKDSMPKKDDPGWAPDEDEWD